MKAQASMVAILMAILMVIFITIFIFSATFSTDQTQDIRNEYSKLYINNMLLSVLRVDTECGIMSDLLKNAYFGGGQCGSGEFGARLPGYMDNVLEASGNTNYDWLLEVTPKNFEGFEKSWGNPDVTEEPGYLDARTLLTWEGSQLEVKLYIKTK